MPVGAHRHFILVTFAIGVLSAAAAGADTEIPLFNSGFEKLSTDGSVVGWRLDLDASTAGGSLHASTEVFHTGVGSIELAHDTPASTVVLSDPVKLQVGHLYRLSAWIRTTNAYSDPSSRYPTAVAACLSMESFPFTNHSRTVGADSDWTRVETVFIATRATDRARLHLGHNGTAAGNAWFDDLRIEQVDDIGEYIPLETVRWFGAGYRYDDRGWIFVHVEGEPYERGYQYGYLVADEIVEYMSKLAIQQNTDDPPEGWRKLRFEADAIFLRGYDEEYLTEMKGIADGAAYAGAEYDGRPLDLLDIVTINSVIDLLQLHDALEVSPHALTGESFLEIEEEMQIAEGNHKCSAFVATGPATADGRVVFGQIFMWYGYTGVHWNVICDLVPSDGNRLVYQTFPGGIHSGADFYLNSAGIVIGETTVSQTPFEPDSTPQSNRIRKAAQYASSIDDVEQILWDGNNGMYTNDWPIADVKTGEVAILLLGTHKKKLWRSSEDISPFGTPGFLWANNNNRDPEVRKEYLAQPEDRPYDLVFTPWNRDIAFNEFYDDHAGSIDATAAVELWASSPINRAHACDGKITTSEMADEMVFLAHYGKVTLREKFPQKGNRIMRDLPGAVPHLSLGYSVVSPIFVTDALQAARAAGRFSDSGSPAGDHELDVGVLEDQFRVAKKQLWRRTIYPATDAENWFVSASAAYWRILAGLDGIEAAEAAGILAEKLGELNARYLYTVAREGDMTAKDAHRAYDRFGPYQIPRIKGSFALHQLRLALGNESFLAVMRETHNRFAGREMTNDDFVAVAEGISGEQVAPLLEQWLSRQGLPELQPEVELRERRGRWELRLRVEQRGEPYRLITHLIVETDGGRHLRRVEIDGPATELRFDFDERPTGVLFNALDDVPVDRSSFFTWRNFLDDFDETLIVYGTNRQIEANHTLARRWQETLANAYVEILPPLVKDSELSTEQLASHDLIVMGPLGDNSIMERLNTELPFRYGPNHFEWQGTTYAEPDDGLFLVMPNPANPDRVVYVVAANSALELYRMTRSYLRGIPSWAVFKGDEIEMKGYHAPADFTLDLGE